jgi:predicted nucleic acid-binding protein
MDVMIAATALTLGVPLVTRNTNDVDRLDVELLQR